MGDSSELSFASRIKLAWSEVVRVAGRQYGVISLAQLLDCGLSRSQVQRLAERGHLHRLHRGVYAVGHHRLIDHGHLIAAQLACGERCFLSHRTAAAVWGLRVVAVKAIEVSVLSGAQRDGLIIHKTTAPFPDEVTIRNGLRVSSVPRLLVELARREKPVELNRLITQAARKSLLNIENVETAMARHARHPGMAKLKAALTGYRPCADRKSDLERAFDDLLHRNPDIPAPQTNIEIEGWEIDCYWPEQQVALELDGRPYHVAVKDMEKDRYKDAKLLGMGIKPLRITDWRMQSDQRGALSDLRALLQLA